MESWTGHRGKKKKTQAIKKRPSKNLEHVKNACIESVASWPVGRDEPCDIGHGHCRGAQPREVGLELRGVSLTTSVDQHAGVGLARAEYGWDQAQ